jgi:peptidoglycan/xylan/chitin deacetylase (PgdA/CDA1 family)
MVLGFVGAGAVAAAVTLWENVDVRELSPGFVATPPPPPLARPAVRPAYGPTPFPAVVYWSEASARYYLDPSFYPESLERWWSLVEDVGGRAQLAYSVATLDTLSADQVLVLAEALCLSDRELDAVERHLQRGGGVVANWSMGARDGACGWRGWGPVADLTGAEDVRELQERRALHVTVPGGHALSPGLDPGTRLQLRGDRSPALRMGGSRVFWSDWALNPAPDESGGGADAAAAVRRTPSGGRVAWFGMRLGQAATPEDARLLRMVVRNGILWAAGLPTAAPAAWPQGNRAAMLHSVDVESLPENAWAVADVLQEADVPATYFAVTSLVQEDLALGQRLLRSGEVASQTTDHAPVAGRTAQEQFLRLGRSWLDSEDWTGEAPVGLHPPEETFDAFTLEGWARAGGRYLLAVNGARSASPEVHETRAGPIVVLPRLMKDDYNVFVQESAIRSQRLADAYLEGAAKLRSLGGLAVISGRTQILNSAERRAALVEVADTARAEGDWWLAEGRDLADWWLARQRLRLRFVTGDNDNVQGYRGVSPTGVPTLIVELAASGLSLDGLWVDVTLPRGTEGVVPWVAGRPSDFASTPWGMRIPVGHLEAGQPRRISFVRMESAADREN